MQLLIALSEFLALQRELGIELFDLLIVAQSKPLVDTF